MLNSLFADITLSFIFIDQLLGVSMRIGIDVGGTNSDAVLMNDTSGNMPRPMGSQH